MTTYTTKSGFAELDNGSMEVNTSGVVVSYTTATAKGQYRWQTADHQLCSQLRTPGEPYHIKSAKFDTVYAGLADSDTPGKSKDSLETWMSNSYDEEEQHQAADKVRSKGRIQTS